MVEIHLRQEKAVYKNRKVVIRPLYNKRVPNNALCVIHEFKISE